MSYLYETCERLHLDDCTDEDLLKELVHCRLSEEQVIELMEFCEEVMRMRFNRTLMWVIE